MTFIAVAFKVHRTNTEVTLESHKLEESTAKQHRSCAYASKSIQ